MFYAMPCDKSASRFLETVIECSDSLLTTLLPIFNLELINKINEYVRDNTANFVFQAICKRLSYEIDRLLVSIHTTTTDIASIINSDKKSQKIQKTQNKQNKKVLLQLVTFSEELLKECTSNIDLFNEIINNKGGVLLWLINLTKSVCDSHIILSTNDNDISDWKTILTSQIVNIWTKNGSFTLSYYLNEKFIEIEKKEENETTTAATGGTSKGKVSGGGPSNFDSKKVILARQLGALLHLKYDRYTRTATTGSKNEDNEDKDTATTAATTAITTCRSLEAIVSAISNLSQETLKIIATSGQLSKALLDPFIHYYFTTTTSTGTNTNTNYYQKFLNNFLSITSFLAAHYVGQHIFRQIYEKITNINDKEKLVKCLYDSRDVLNKTKEGRNSLKLVNMDGYVHDKNDWLRNLKKQNQAKDLLYELDNFTGDSNNKNIKLATGKNNKTNETTKITPVSIQYNNENEGGNGKEDDEEVEDVNGNINTSEKDIKKRKRKRTHTKNNKTSKLTIFDN